MAKTHYPRGNRPFGDRRWRNGPRQRPRGRSQSQAPAVSLAVLLAALVGWNLNVWLMPAPLPMPMPMPAVPQPLELAETPDPWATSRDQRRLLEAQEGPPSELASAPSGVSAGRSSDTISASFALCGGGARVTCVVDGDTFWLQGRKIRIADIDTPEVSSPRCPAELARGRQATQRLAGLLNAGPFALESVGRAEDRYGRALFRVTRGGSSIGNTLVDEGLAVRFGNGRPDWC